MPRVLMNFQLLNDWVVHFIEADCKTTIGTRTRYFHFPNEAEFRAFVGRCNLVDPVHFEESISNRARGSDYANLTEEQYTKLRA
jgi:hypothetical protein